MVDMQVIVRRQHQKLCASITCMIRHYVARRAKVIFDHPHNAEKRTLRGHMLCAANEAERGRAAELNRAQLAVEQLGLRRPLRRSAARGRRSWVGESPWRVGS